MRGFRRRFRARGRRRRPIFARVVKRYNNVFIGLQTLAAATTVTEQLLTVADSPDHTLVSDGTNAIQVENNSRILGMKVKLDIACSAIADPIAVSFMLWKDAAHGGITSPTSTSNILAPSTTTQLGMLKANTCMYRRWLFTTQGDHRTYFLKVPRRLRQLREGEQLMLTVTNHAPDTDTILFEVIGRIFTAS